jgi:branched-chain amino acid transport system permease protein
VRPFIVAVLMAGALLVVTQVVLPGRGGRGTPAAILFSGFVAGMVNALIAAGLILVYRTTRIVNFAQTAIGAAGASFCFQLVQFTKTPFPLAFLAGLAVAGLIGLAFDLVFGRRFFNAPRLVLTVLTIIAAGFISSTSIQLITRLPIFPSLQSRSFDELFGSSLGAHLPFRGLHFHVGALPVPFGFPEVFAIEVAVLALLALAAFFRLTRSGVAVRAMAENAERATLLGIGVGTVSSLVWTLTGVLSGAGVTITGLVSSPAAATGFAPDVLLPALAAAVIARMRSLPVAVLAATMISVGTKAFEWSLRDDVPLVRVLLFVVVAAGLLFQRRELLRMQDTGTGSWQASEEQRPIPAPLLAVPGVRFTRRALIALGLVAVGLYPFVTSTGQTNLGGVIALNAIVAISLVVLTGWAGQVSLGQFGLVAVGAVVGGALTARADVPFWVAVPLAAAFTGAFAALVGIPALRLKGLFLAVTTVAFAIAVAAVLFEQRYFGWLLPRSVKRPSFFFIDFDDERSMYFLCVAALVAVIVVVVNLRRSRFGRLLIALRENEANVQSFAVSVVRMKLAAFAVSGALAGFAGAIFAHQQRGLSAQSYGAAASIDVFVLTVVGGIGSVGGALLGAVYINSVQYLITNDLLLAFLSGGFTLVLLYVAPGGLMSIVTAVRDGALRIVAQRRQLVVPSLFADYDPQALERKLVPIGPPSASAGLATLPADVRFAQESVLYRYTEATP